MSTASWKFTASASRTVPPAGPPGHAGGDPARGGRGRGQARRYRLVLDYAADDRDGLSATVVGSTPRPPHVVAARPEKSEQNKSNWSCFRGQPDTVQTTCSDGKSALVLRAGVPMPDGGVRLAGPPARARDVRRGA